MQIVLLQTDHEREQVYRLVHDEYVRAGYIFTKDDRRFVHYCGLFDRIPQTDVFLAYDDNGEFIGTNTLTRDSEYGIHTDVDFKERTDKERCTKKNLASSWRIVTRNDRRKASGTVNALIRATVQRAKAIGVDTCLFTFHPDHMCVYHIALNMKMIGFSERTEGLVNAPSVLMKAVTSEVPARWFRE